MGKQSSCHSEPHLGKRGDHSLWLVGGGGGGAWGCGGGAGGFG